MKKKFYAVDKEFIEPSLAQSRNVVDSVPPVSSGPAALSESYPPGKHVKP